MRAHGLLGVAALLAMAACVNSSDPRARHVEDMERSTLGAWIIVTDRHGHDTHGELISVEPTQVRVIAWSPATSPHPTVSYEAASLATAMERPTTQIAIPRSDIAHARLFRYTADDCNLWGVEGAFSTITHIFFIVISLPAWVGAAITAEAIESRHVLLEYPDHSLDEFASWARFPQGMPPDLDPRVLISSKGPQPSR